ncbi:MAG: hypothetical protein QG603_200 [Patescibacteria group bacterium]|jgi:hypothetical protein|nr:hypothetical protein [Patescibacteria group bacterium]MDQ5970423.1 hypothetical protein [Patescibacteria group bacterium]
MRKYFLLSLCSVLLISLLSGCSAFQTEFRDEQGRALDHPYGNEPPITRLTFHLSWDVPVFVSVDGGTKVPLPYGRGFPVETRAQKHIPYELWWIERVSSGDDQLSGIEHHLVGLYTGEPIIVDEFLLRGWTRLEVIVHNASSQTKTFSTMQGESFTLQPQQWKTIFVVAGDFVLIWPANDGQTIRGRRCLTTGHKVPWKGRSVDAYFMIHDFVPNMHQRRILRNGGYLNL